MPTKHRIFYAFYSIKTKSD